jgi:hypothetical protein
MSEVAHPADRDGELCPPKAIGRWELSGGTWRIAVLVEDHVIIELLRCDGGEVAEALTLRDADDLRWAAQQLALGTSVRSHPDS